MGTWIKKRRNELKMTQEEVTARLQLGGLDISRSAFAHWDSGRYKPPLDQPNVRHILADALELDVREMLVLAGYEVTENEEDELVVRATIIMSNLPIELKKHAFEYLKMLEKQAKVLP